MDENNIKMREFIYSLIDVKQKMKVLDLGCGKGYDLSRIAQLVDGESLLHGIDFSEKSIAAAKEEYATDPRIQFIQGDVTQGIDFASNTFDVVFSNNLLECVTDKQSLIKDVHRVLKPRGQVIFAHFDWDSQLFDGDNKVLIRKVVQTYNDWQQAWMADADAWMGRRLWRTFQESGLFSWGRIETYVLTNTEFAEPNFGYMRAQDFKALVKRNMITKAEYADFLNGIKQLAAKEQYFYSITKYIYIGIK